MLAGGEGAIWLLLQDRGRGGVQSIPGCPPPTPWAKKKRLPGGPSSLWRSGRGGKVGPIWWHFLQPNSNKKIMSVLQFYLVQYLQHLKLSAIVRGIGRGD